MGGPNKLIHTSFLGALLIRGVLQEPVTYVVGEWGTYNEAAKLMETFYGTPSLRIADVFLVRLIYSSSPIL